jgi:RNA polymerase sigma factor (sigma-70 family)
VEQLNNLVIRAKTGDLDACSRLVQATQAMVYGVALGVLRDPEMARDAAQEAYLRAFRRLADLEEPAAFISWLRRIVITVGTNIRQARRVTLLRLDDVPVVPVLDEAETSWSEVQRQLLAGALLTLTGPDRRLCDRRYHGIFRRQRHCQLCRHLLLRPIIYSPSGRSPSSGPPPITARSTPPAPALLCFTNAILIPALVTPTTIHMTPNTRSIPPESHY